MVFMSRIVGHIAQMSRLESITAVIRLENIPQRHGFGSTQSHEQTAAPLSSSSFRRRARRIASGN
jgi:hypothetical protein